MLDNPRAKLFQFQDHWGEFEDYHYSRSQREGMCSDLRKLSRRVKSVFTFGKCIRLFGKKSCNGWSLAVYPGSPNSHRLETIPRHVTFQSIGPCLGNEFSGGYLNQSMPRLVTKNPELRNFQPDLVMMFNPDIDTGRAKYFGAVRVNYLLGPGNRTEIVQSVPSLWMYSIQYPISKTRLAGGDFDKLSGKVDVDVLGHGIPTIFGGPANEAFNIFPASQSTMIEWEDLLLPSFNSGREFRSLDLQFEYEDENSTRPLFFYYYTHLRGNDEPDDRRYGRIINGHETNLKRAKPYSQVVPKFEYKGNRNINLSHVLDHHRETSKVISDFSRNSTSLQSVNTRTSIPVNNWDSDCKQTIRNNGIELEGNMTLSFRLNVRIQEMIQNPMVRLFSGENLTGNYVDHSGQKRQGFLYKGCNYLDDLKNVTSAETFGACVRLFEKPLCSGLSLAVYGRIGNLRLDRNLKQVQSVGPCLQNEFLNATFRDEIRGHVVKDRYSSSYFPDLVQFSGFKTEEPSIFRRAGFYNVIYILGPKGRIEYINTRISQVGTSRFRETLKGKETEFYKSLDKKEGDVPCYAIPKVFHGPEDESFNIFPMSESKLDDWARIFPSTSDPNEEILFQMQLLFVYDNVKSTRPQFVYYRIFSWSILKIYYGRFNNI